VSNRVVEALCWLSAALALMLQPVMADQYAPVRDSFEGAGLSEIWDGNFAPADRLALTSGGASAGKQYLALSVRPGDFDPGCKCQRTEIREADAIRPEFGSDLWYRFRIRLSDVSGGLTTSRWMVGAWKQDADGSPFLAMRFEGGIFYITLESADTRVMLGSTLVDARGFIQIMKGGQGNKFGFITDADLYLTDNGIQLKHGEIRYLPDPRNGWVDLMFRVKGGLEGDGVVEVYANNNFVVRATGKIGVEAPAGSGQYLRLGHRRDKADTSAVMQIDDFRRGSSREAVSD
jgi:hypothetical protein